MVRETWNFTRQQTFQNSFNKILMGTYENHSNEIIRINLEEILTLINKLKYM